MEWASFTPGVSGAVPTGSLWAARVNNAQQNLNCFSFCSFSASHRTSIQVLFIAIVSFQQKFPRRGV